MLGWFLAIKGQTGGVVEVSLTFDLITLSIHLGTLADGLDCFPFDDEVYPPPSDSCDKYTGIRSLIRVDTLV